MSPRRRTIVILAVLAALGGVRAAPGQDKPVAVPPELAKLLSAAQEDLRSGRPRAAIDRLMAYRGKDHALRHLVLAHAHAGRSDLPSAGGAYRQALSMSPRMREAGIGLAQVYARQENWADAARLLGRFVKVDACGADVLMLYADACGADVLMLYAQVAQRLEDRRLAGLLARKGIVRFPRDVRFRRLDLAVLMDEGDHAAAARAVTVLLAETPADAALWRQLFGASLRSAAAGREMTPAGWLPWRRPCCAIRPTCRVTSSS